MREFSHPKFTPKFPPKSKTKQKPKRSKTKMGHVQTHNGYKSILAVNVVSTLADAGIHIDLERSTIANTLGERHVFHITNTILSCFEERLLESAARDSLLQLLGEHANIHFVFRSGTDSATLETSAPSSKVISPLPSPLSSPFPRRSTSPFSGLQGGVYGKTTQWIDAQKCGLEDFITQGLYNLVLLSYERIIYDYPWRARAEMDSNIAACAKEQCRKVSVGEIPPNEIVDYGVILPIPIGISTEDVYSAWRDVSDVLGRKPMHRLEFYESVYTLAMQWKSDDDATSRVANSLFYWTS